MKTASKVLDEGEILLIGIKEMRSYLTYTVPSDLICKIYLIAGGHCDKSVTTQATIPSLVSKSSVYLAVLFSAPNDLNVLCAGIGKASLIPFPRELCCVISRSKFV